MLNFCTFHFHWLSLINLYFPDIFEHFSTFHLPQKLTPPGYPVSVGILQEFLPHSEFTSANISVTWNGPTKFEIQNSPHLLRTSHVDVHPFRTLDMWNNLSELKASLSV